MILIKTRIEASDVSRCNRLKETKKQNIFEDMKLKVNLFRLKKYFKIFVMTANAY